MQRELEYALAPGLEWGIEGFLDLETVRATKPAVNRSRSSSTTRSRTSLHSQAKADDDPQAGLYLAGRWLAGDPAEHLLRRDRQPGKKRKTMTTRSASPAARRGAAGTLARIAQAASQIAALYDRYGPDEPGGSPTRAAGSARPATARTRALPGGAGL